MKLVVVAIKRFRSIENIKIENCGDFNVLIGKNNSGKSNILSAIQAFFACIQNSDVITLEPPVERTLDFFRGQSTRSTIEITLTFSLALNERDVLIQSIVRDAPQMKHAIEGIAPSLQLAITICIASTSISASNYFGFVSKIDLLSPPNSEIRERTILKIEKESAQELYEQLSRSRLLRKSIEAISSLERRIDRDDWRVLQTDSKGSGSSSIRSFLRRNLPSSTDDTIRKVETAIAASSSYDDFLIATRNLSKSMQEEMEGIQEEPLRHKIGTFSGEETTIPDYVRRLLQSVSEMKVLYLKEQRKPIGKEEAARILALKTRRGGAERFRNIQDAVSALLGVKIDAFTSELVPIDGRFLAELDIDDFLVEVNGSGIREALRLVLDVEFEKPTILLVEEPEIHLHPSLETSMMRFLKRTSENRQVFVTTHSTNFLDTAEMKNVYLISKPRSTQVQLLDYEEAEIQIPKELGIRLSSLFLFDRLVFVEGQSDVDIIREWASIIGINLNQNSVGFIPMGGARNMMYYAAEGTLSFLKKRQVRMWFLIDRDERNDPEIAKLKADLGQRVTFKVLNKREIENYLICPQAVAKFIKLKREMTLNDKEVDVIEPDVLDIKNTIDECAENLKQFAIDKRVARLLYMPIRPSFEWNTEGNQKSSIVEQIIDANQKIIKQLEDAKARVQEVYEEQVSSVNDAWQRHKLDLVPGDHLLDMVCKKYKVRFKKELDGSRLAALMSEFEIDEEIKEIISEIGN